MNRTELNTNIDTNLASGQQIPIATLRAQLKTVLDYLDQQDSLQRTTNFFWNEPSRSLTIKGRPYVEGQLMSPPYTEYYKTDGINGARVQVGGLGGREANVSYNMDYKDGIHHYFDTTENAVWMALGPGQPFHLLALQYVKSGHANNVDIYDAYGKVAFSVFPIDSGDAKTGGSSVNFMEWKMYDLVTDNSPASINKTNGIVRIYGNVTFPDYADNAAAVAAGLQLGSLYRTGDTLKIVH